MKFKNRKEEILAQYAAKEQARIAESVERQQADIRKAFEKPVLHADHPVPTTRRELVGAGLLSGLAYAVVPSIFTLAAQNAYGVECPKGGSGGTAARVPGYLHIELSGGYSPAKQFPPGKQEAGTAFVPLATAGYATIGYGPTQAPGTVALSMDFGLPYHPTSPLVLGMRDVMSTAALAKTVASAICSVSGDDTANNPLNPVQLVTKIAGNGGSLLQIAKDRDGATGGRTAPLNIAQDPGLAGAVVANEAALANLVNPGLLASRFANNPQAAVRVAELAHKLSASKLAQFQAKDLNQQVKDLIECGYIGAKDLLTEFTPDKLQVSTDTQLNTAYNAMTFAQAFTGDNAQAMIMSKLLVDGLSTAGTIEIAGYDYHGQGLTVQDQKDRAAGQVIGLALEVAHRKGQPLFVCVTTDGSVAFGAGGAVNDRLAAASDNGGRSMILMFGIGTTAKPQMNFHQIGKFNDGGAVDTSYLVTSNTAAIATLCAAYNYASFAGRLTQFESLLAANGATNPFKGNEKQYQAFAPKV
jgi:hypothetical protein